MAGVVNPEKEEWRVGVKQRCEGLGTRSNLMFWHFHLHSTTLFLAIMPVTILEGLAKGLKCTKVVYLPREGCATKSDEFSEKFRRGGGAFSIQKFILQNFDL